MAKKERGKPHDYDVSAMDKDNDRVKGHVGRAWIKEGHISVVLNPFVVVRGGYHALTLFPANRFKKEENTDDGTT